MRRARTGPEDARRLLAALRPEAKGAAAAGEDIIVTNHGKPVAVVTGIDGEDFEKIGFRIFTSDIEFRRISTSSQENLSTCRPPDRGLPGGHRRQKAGDPARPRRTQRLHRLLFPS
jgi:antitoxin (DNA-binding transcriptional repressor) of toxin-antitoxin stability system